VNTKVGLREHKKQKTRQLIADTARRLFAEQGFDQVTVAEIARAAEVSEPTVFNYFPTKEDLVYQRMEAFQEEMLAAIRNRPTDQSLVAAFGDFILEVRGLLASEDEQDIKHLTALVRVIAESPALLAREREVFERYTDALAVLIREESGAAVDDVEAWVTANALIGLHRALVEYARQQVLVDTDRKRIAQNIEQRGRRALARLEHGLEAALE
jgi:AcrR family transcriptional regulator